MPMAAGVAFGLVLSLPLWTSVIWLVTGFLIWAHTQSQYQPEYFRFHGEDVSVWTDGDVMALSWHGEGRRSHAFLQWQLYDDEGQVTTLQLWRDAVSEPSWRALNMAYRVGQAAASSDTKAA